MGELHEIFRAVCLVSGYSKRELLAPDRRAWIVSVRRLLMLMMREADSTPSIDKIGRIVQRDHNTVFIGCKAARKDLEDNPRLRGLRAGIEAVLELQRRAKEKVFDGVI